MIMKVRGMKYHGKACPRCDNTLRYKSNRSCVFCKSSKEINKRYPGYRADADKRRRMKVSSSFDTREFYIEAQLKTHMTGIPHEVDHIVPLNHPLICGLHNRWNLQVITAEANREKSNNFDISEHPVWMPSNSYYFM